MKIRAILMRVAKMARKNRDTMRVGRTIAQEWEKQESESERLLNRKKEKTRKIIKVLSFLAVVGIVAVIVAMEVSTLIDKRERIEAEKNAIQPTVEIIDEAGTGITTRMKEYVGQIEGDFAELGYTVNRAVVPAGKNREIDVFLNGYEYYIKLNIDRGTAVSAEDAARMVRYVSERDVRPSYIDVRVKGKGYFK